MTADKRSLGEDGRRGRGLAGNKKCPAHYRGQRQGSNWYLYSLNTQFLPDHPGEVEGAGRERGQELLGLGPVLKLPIPRAWSTGPRRALQTA